MFHIQYQYRYRFIYIFEFFHLSIYFFFVSKAAADIIGRPAAGVARGLNTLRDNSRWFDSKWYGRNYLEAGLCRSLGAPQSLVLLLNGLQRPLHMEPGCLRK